MKNTKTIMYFTIIISTIFLPIIFTYASENEAVFKENYEYNICTGESTDKNWTGYVKVLGYKNIENNKFIYCSPVTKWGDSDIKEVYVPIDKIRMIVARERVDINALSEKQLKSYAWKLFDKEKSYGEAKTAYEKYLERFPSSEDADDVQLMIGNCLYWMTNSEEDIGNTIKAYEDLIKKYPNSQRLADAYLYLGQIWQGLSGIENKAHIDLNKAIEYYEKAIAEKNSRKWIKAQALGRIGQCLEKQGKKDEAIKKYNEVIENYPDEPWAKEAKGLLEKMVQAK